MTPPPALVSILVPCYNAQRWLAATLESALGQTWPRCEIIVVDDGSRDGSLALARQFESRGVKVIAQANAGAAAARNTALRAARGDYLQFLDADDLIAPDKITRQMQRLAGGPPGAIASSAWARFQLDPLEADFRPEPAWRDFPVAVDFLRLHFNEGWMMFPAAWLVPRSVAEAAGPWDTRLSLNDDGEYFCRVIVAASAILFCGDARSFYRSGMPGSLSWRKDAAAYRSLVLSIELNTATLFRHADTPATREALANAWNKLAHEIYPTLPAESRRALQRCREFGGPTRPVEMGARLQRWSNLIGWRLAKRLQQFLRARGAS